jgi:uncharacterized protein (TIGR02270 family)
MQMVQSLPESLSQHADYASFLWLQRHSAVSAPHYSLADLAKLDNRVEANLDGLRIAGEAGWEICNEALNMGEPGEIFAAAVLAFESGKQDRIDAFLELAASSRELSSAVASALGWLPFPQAENHVGRLLASSSPALQRVGIAACAIHRQNPGAPLLNAIASTDSVLKARALRAIGELGLDDLCAEASQYLNAEDELCRFWAAWSIAMVTPEQNAIGLLVTVAESNGPNSHRALQLAIRRMDEAAAGAWIDRLSQEKDKTRAAITAAGAFGEPSRIPWLIDQMDSPESTRLAGEAFTMITGVDIAYQDLDADKPDDFEGGPTEDPDDENVEMDPDEHLPWPDPKLIARWWSQHRDEFQNGTRYLFGRPISIDWCRQVLRIGRQRQRAAAALELAILQPGQPLFNVSAPGSRQQQMLGIKR